MTKCGIPVHFGTGAMALNSDLSQKNYFYFILIDPSAADELWYSAKRMDLCHTSCTLGILVSIHVTSTTKYYVQVEVSGVAGLPYNPYTLMVTF